MYVVWWPGIAETRLVIIYVQCQVHQSHQHRLLSIPGMAKTTMSMHIIRHILGKDVAHCSGCTLQVDGGEYSAIINITNAIRVMRSIFALSKSELSMV